MMASIPAIRQITALDSTLALTEAQSEAIRPIIERRSEELLNLRQQRATNESLSRREKRRLVRSLRGLMRVRPFNLTSRQSSSARSRPFVRNFERGGCRVKRKAGNRPRFDLPAFKTQHVDEQDGQEHGQYSTSKESEASRHANRIASDW